MDMKFTHLVDRAFSQISKKEETLVVQYDVTSVYREYVNETYRGLSIIQCLRIGIDGKNFLVLPLLLDLVDDNLSFRDWPHFSDLKISDRSHLFRKERTREL